MTQAQQQHTAKKQPPSGPPQVDAGDMQYSKYMITTAAGPDTGYVISTAGTAYNNYDYNGQAYSLAAHSEYWDLPSGILAALQSARTSWIQFQGEASANYPSSGPINPFSAVATASSAAPVSSLVWTRQGSIFVPSNAFYNGGTVAVGFSHLSFSSLGGTWTGHFDWYFLGTAAPTSPLILSNTTTTLHYGTASAATGRNSWWYAGPTVTSVYLP